MESISWSILDFSFSTFFPLSFILRVLAFALEFDSSYGSLLPKRLFF